MIKERIKEIFEFTKSESPYRKANKGWINQDIFVDLNPSSDTVKQKNEAAKVILLWSPINSLLSNIFLILVLGSILVFSSLSIAKGRFDFNLFSTSMNSLIVEIDNEKSPKEIYKDDLIDSKNPKKDQSPDINGIDKINLLDDNLLNLDEKKIIDKIDQQEIRKEDIQINKDARNLQIKNSKSNFI